MKKIKVNESTAALTIFIPVPLALIALVLTKFSIVLMLLIGIVILGYYATHDRIIEVKYEET